MINYETQTDIIGHEKNNQVILFFDTNASWFYYCTKAGHYPRTSIFKPFLHYHARIYETRISNNAFHDFPSFFKISEMFHYEHLSNVGQHQQPNIRIEKGSKTTFTAPLQFKVNATATREVILYLGKQKFYLTKISMSTNWKMHSKPYQATPQLAKPSLNTRTANAI